MARRASPLSNHQCLIRARFSVVGRIEPVLSAPRRSRCSWAQMPASSQSLSRSGRSNRSSPVQSGRFSSGIPWSGRTKAVSGLPMPKNPPPAEVGGRNAALNGRCIAGVSGCPEPSPPVTESTSSQKENPADGGLYVSSCHSVAEAGKVVAAGIEPAEESDLNSSGVIACDMTTPDGAARALHAEVSDWHLLSSIDPQLLDVVAAWPLISVELKTAIVAMVCSVRPLPTGSPPG